MRQLPTNERQVARGEAVILENWRRKRDSNPRTSYPVNGFQDRRLQPLGHSSAFHRTRFRYTSGLQYVDATIVNSCLLTEIEYGEPSDYRLFRIAPGTARRALDTLGNGHQR